MPSGKVDVRYTPRTDKNRLRFYSVAHDQVEVIKHALQIAREEFSTEFDSVALDHICLSFIETRNGTSQINTISEK